jgi:F-type H+-transporting ATPase subunit b
MKLVPILSAGLLLVPVAARAAGMPQLDFSSPLTISQVVWGAIIFALLYFILARKGLPLVASVLDERASKIAHDLEGARAAKLSADAGMAEAQAATAKARAEGQAAVSAAVNEAKAAAAAQAESLNARLEAQLQESETQIAQARASAMGAIRQVARDTATTVVTRLTGAPPAAGIVDAAIASAMDARGIA